MKILFLGTPEFSAEILKRIPPKHTITAVVSQPDRAKDRKGNLLPTPLKKYAVENGIKVYQFERIKKSVDELKAIDADIFITAAYGQILSQEIIDLPRYGIVNVHTSLLPHYRGSSPIQSAILNGDKVTGVTIMQTDVGMDTGDIILSQSVTIGDKTAGELTEELIEVGASLLAEALDEIEAGTAYVTTPVEPDKAAKEKILKRLLETTDYQEFEIHYSVDESLIGGMIIRIGDRVVDSSIKHKLLELSRQLQKIDL